MLLRRFTLQGVACCFRQSEPCKRGSKRLGLLDAVSNLPIVSTVVPFLFLL